LNNDSGNGVVATKNLNYNQICHQRQGQKWQVRNGCDCALSKATINPVNMVILRPSDFAGYR